MDVFRKKIRIAVILMTALAAGCATLFSDPEDQITFTSDPPNVKVYKDSRFIGTTPMTIPVKKVGMAAGRLNVFRFEKQGYRPQEFTLTTQLNNIALFNNITVVSWLTDFFTGTVTEYAPTKYHVILESDNQVMSDGFYTRSLAQRYILLFFDDVARDAFTGGGVHTNNLMDILKVNEVHRSAFVSLVKENISARTTPPALITGLDTALKTSDQLSRYSFL